MLFSSCHYNTVSKSVLLALTNIRRCNSGTHQSGIYDYYVTPVEDEKQNAGIYDYYAPPEDEKRDVGIYDYYASVASSKKEKRDVGIHHYYGPPAEKWQEGEARCWNLRLLLKADV